MYLHFHQRAGPNILSFDWEKEGIHMISVKGLEKEFNGFRALRGLDMHVKSGEIYGFIGQNGAGKSTTMSILAGLSRQKSGCCIVNGQEVSSIRHPSDLHIGYLPEEPKFYPWMTARETLEYLSGGRDTGQISKILEWTGLAQSAERRVGGFSRGMKQRLGIGATLVRDPELFILDEPSSALDPEGRSEVLHLIEDLKNMGKTVLFSTHILDDVERVCDTIGMISAGRMVFEKSLAQLQSENEQPIFDITTSAPIDSKSLDTLKLLAGVISVTEDPVSYSVRVKHKSIAQQLTHFFADREIVVEFFALRKTRLEDLFLKEVNAK